MPTGKREAPRLPESLRGRDPKSPTQTQSDVVDPLATDGLRRATCVSSGLLRPVPQVHPTGRGAPLGQGTAHLPPLFGGGRLSEALENTVEVKVFILRK